VNIAIISPQIYPCNTGGLEIFNYYLIRELAAQGHKIWVITCCGYKWNNQNIHRVKLWRRFPGLTFLSISFSIIFNLIKLKKKIDVMHIPYTSNSNLIYSMLLGKKFTNIPYIITIHGGGMHKWRLGLFHQLFFKYANSIVAVSEIIRKEYEKRCVRKIKVIPPLIPFIKTDIARSELKSKYGFSDNDVIILSLGSIKKIKGSNILQEAFFNLGKEYVKSNNLRLLYVGEGAMKNELKKKVDEKSFSQYVKFFGKIPREKVPEMYKLADIYVISSLFEGMPIALLEAMFNGLPIIGSNVNGINNLISHKKNGLLFERENIDDLTNKIKELLNDTNLAAGLGKSAKNDYSKGYIFKNVILDHIKLYKKQVEQ